MTRLTAHFTLAELTHSDYALRVGINNTLPASLMDNINRLAMGLERIRGLLGSPMHINSGYRGEDLNRAIGGSKSSAHMQALAADFTCQGFGTPLEICQVLERNQDHVAFDQLIFEGSWVHVAFAPISAAPKKEILTAHFVNGKAHYRKGLEFA